MKISDVMTHAVIAIPGVATVAEAVKVMRQHQIDALIVDQIDEQDAYGIVTAADVVSKVVALGRDPKRIRVYQIMTKPCIVLNPSLGVEYAARLMAQTGIHCAPVIQGKLLGIVTHMDILQRSDFVENPQEVRLAEQIEQSMQIARTICQTAGLASQDCADAWTKVEALQAEAAHQQSMPLEKTAFEAFGEEYPEAMGRQEYDAWCSG